jgi:hypothetical protein
MRYPVDYHALAVDLVEYACGGSEGRPETDPVYQAVTEGRDRPPYPNKYSSCGDLAHWLLYRLGVRLPFVNRDEHLGWWSGVNVSRFAFDTPLAIRRPPATDRCKPGDIGIVWSNPGATDAHVFIFLDDQRPGAVFVGEYGQPGGRLNTRRVGVHGGKLSIGTRALERVLRLDDVIDAADASGFLEPPESASMFATRLELPTMPAPPPDPEAA